jgi:uncharacterized coiled-coil DUF342 family protein
VGKSRLTLASTLVAVALAWLARPPLCVADGPSSEVLKKHGLQLVGSLALVDEEAQIKSNLAEARRLSKQLSYSLMQQKGTMSPQEMQKTAKSIGTEINQLKSEMNAVNQQMSRVPRNHSRYGGRYAGGAFVSSDAAAIYSQLAFYRAQLQMELNQDTYFLNQLKNQTSDPKAKERIDSEVRDRRDAYHEAILELRKLVDSATDKYEELAKNDEVKKALSALGKGQREKPKLGPSHEFKNNVKLLERLERTESGGASEAAEAKPTRRGRRRSSSKRADTQANAGSSQ